MDTLHPFLDKLVVFIGTPQRCKRAEARDALFNIGGIPDETVTAFTSFVVAFSGAQTTKAYKKALHYDRLLTILTEDEFFDILEGKALPPEKPRNSVTTTVIPSANADMETRAHEQFMEEHINRKRINFMARYGVPTPDGRIKVDMKFAEKMSRLSRFIDEKAQET